jgi:hypothetical protein
VSQWPYQSVLAEEYELPLLLCVGVVYGTIGNSPLWWVLDPRSHTTKIMEKEGAIIDAVVEGDHYLVFLSFPLNGRPCARKYSNSSLATCKKKIMDNNGHLPVEPLQLLSSAPFVVVLFSCNCTYTISCFWSPLLLLHITQKGEVISDRSNISPRTFHCPADSPLYRIEQSLHHPEHCCRHVRESTTFLAIGLFIFASDKTKKNKQ